MQIQFHQVKQLNHLGLHISGSHLKRSTDTSLHARRRMLKAQDEAKETEAARLTLSSEAMKLAHQAKEIDRIEQLINSDAQNVQTADADAQEEMVHLTDEEIYDELLNQMNIWGDKSSALLDRYDHKETAEMVEEKAAALNGMQKLEQLRKSALEKAQAQAQADSETFSMQQEDINKKNAELIMMLESFKGQDDEEDEESASVNQKEEEDARQDDAGSGSILLSAAESEMNMLGEIEDARTLHSVSENNNAIKCIEDERISIYRAIGAENFNLKDKIALMSDFVCTLGDGKEIKESFQKRIENETDESAKKKLTAMMDYFNGLTMKNVYHDLKQEREYALQGKINARDLRIAYLGNRNLMFAGREEALQEQAGVENFIRKQGQGYVAGYAQEISERLQKLLDDRDHINMNKETDEEKNRQDVLLDNEKSSEEDIDKKGL